MSEHSRQLLDQAEALHRQGRPAEAIESFRQVLAEQPGASEGWYELGYLLKADGQFEEALTAYAQALSLGIRRPEEVHLNRAVIYSDHLRRDEDAERELDTAIAAAPDFVPALLNRGNLHEERGQRAEALACYDRVLAGAGRQDHPHRDLCLVALARSARLRPPAEADDPVIRRLQDAAASPTSPVVRANLLFSLGQAYERLEQFDPAFDAFAKANRWLLRASGRAYDRAQSSRLTDELIRRFPGAVSANPNASPDAEGGAPLFICGMFRSGSTLVEQVLAAHPQVSAGGELNWLRRLVTGRLAPFPESVATIDAHRYAELAEEYRAHLAHLFPDAAGRYVTDKRPDNFQLIGLIKRLFPSARIIHTCRHPMDTGLSVYLQHMELRVAGYASDLGDIGHYYGQYRRLMAHWHTLYPGSIFDFDYDDFVRAPKPALERLFAFLDLEPDDRCLDFHQLGNTVKTASYWQIRQPLNDRASGRWRSYRAHLAPLRHALDESGVILDDE